MTQVAADVAAIVGTEPRPVRPWPMWVRRLLRVFVPILRELDETAHQFERPFVVDSTAAEERFGLVPTPWEEALAATLDATRVPA